MGMEKSVSAAFLGAPQDSHRLMVVKAGNGTVTGIPEGIDCGGECSGYYAPGTEVTLTATPAFGWVFAGWSGACTGTELCQVSMEQETTVFAVFESGTPVARFMGTPLEGAAPLTVQFTDQSTGSLNSWVWDFGDGAGSTEQNPTHTYTENGTYRVSLNVSGPYGSDADVKDGYVTVFTADVVYVAPDGTCSDHNPCYRTIQGGIDAAPNEATVRITQGDYDEALILNAPKDIRLEGGWDVAFTIQTSCSRIQSLKIRNGAVRSENLVIR